MSAVFWREVASVVCSPGTPSVIFLPLAAVVYRRPGPYLVPGKENFGPSGLKPSTRFPPAVDQVNELGCFCGQLFQKVINPCDAIRLPNYNPLCHTPYMP